METVTLQGPIIILPAEEYQMLLNRLTQLEHMVNRMTKLLEDLEDLKVMHEAEAEYRTGDIVSFADILAEVQAEIE